VILDVFEKHKRRHSVLDAGERWLEITTLTKTFERREKEDEGSKAKKSGSEGLALDLG
jgi:hypothetical protein